jgi:hypothetical protein
LQLENTDRGARPPAVIAALCLQPFPALETYSGRLGGSRAPWPSAHAIKEIRPARGGATVVGAPSSWPRMGPLLFSFGSNLMLRPTGFSLSVAFGGMVFCG